MYDINNGLFGKTIKLKSESAEITLPKTDSDDVKERANSFVAIKGDFPRNLYTVILRLRNRVEAGVGEAKPIKVDSSDLPGDFVGTAYYVIYSFLSPREQSLILSRYERHMTLEEIAIAEGVSKQRIYDVERTALKRLSDPRVFEILSKGIFEYCRDQTSDAVERVRLGIHEAFDADDEEGAPEPSIKDFENDFDQAVTYVRSMTPIYHLGLSRRSMNALLRAGISTEGQIIATDLSQIQGLGKKSIEEINNLMLARSTS